MPTCIEAQESGNNTYMTFTSRACTLMIKQLMVLYGLHRHVILFHGVQGLANREPFRTRIVPPCRWMPSTTFRVSTIGLFFRS